VFQTTINFGATTMAVAGGGAGRTSVLVFTMPFWTLLIARPVLHERVRGLALAAIVFAFAGLLLVVEPWAWHGDLAPKLWAVLSGFGWAAGTSR
jgi:drug/metabolite transporter (DMT)-like permease